MSYAQYNQQRQGVSAHKLAAYHGYACLCNMRNCATKIASYVQDRRGRQKMAKASFPQAVQAELKPALLPVLSASKARWSITLLKQ
jgi:hypothetical protein